jgi:hypothetical protein
MHGRLAAAGTLAASAGRLARLSRVSAAIGLTFDKPFGEMNQHPLCSMIPQLVKRPQPASTLPDPLLSIWSF